MRWLADYGAFIAATVAAVAALANNFLSARRDKKARHTDWQRQLRAPRYAAFLRAAQRQRRELLWRLAEDDPEILGPKPTFFEPDVAEAEFLQELAEVTLVGPSAVAAAARIVQYSMWHYQAQLEEDPFAYDQSTTQEAIESFIREAKVALDVADVADVSVPNYRVWLKDHPLPSDVWRRERLAEREAETAADRKADET